jgi:hypothetical protein
VRDLRVLQCEKSGGPQTRSSALLSSCHSEEPTSDEESALFVSQATSREKQILRRLVEVRRDSSG